ncbi:unnamed protein product, partial [marine sediment metagenome]
YMKLKKNVVKLKKIISLLRSPNGCPWDRSMSLKSLCEFILEEVYEVCEACENENPQHIKEELGDILSQIFMISQIAEEKSYFSINDVFQQIIDKLIKRHPHVFKDVKVENAFQALEVWNAEKQKEKQERKSRLDGLPARLPSLLFALKIQRKAASYGIDNENNKNKINQLIQKTKEKFDEFVKKINFEENKNKKNLNTEKNLSSEKFEKVYDNQNNITNIEKIEEEFGDILFLFVNISRKIGINPDSCLRKSINKFVKKFQFVEAQINKIGKDFTPPHLLTLS